MDNKVIEVLDYMGEKLGIAIDWTSANDCHHELYDDEERKKELRKSIREFEMKLGLMVSELEELEEASM